MSFLKRLFSRSGPERRAAAPRVPVGPLLNIRFHPMEPAFTSYVSLANLSTTGMALLPEKSFHDDWPAVGSEVRGQLVFHDRQFPVAVEIVHRGPALVGCRFIGGLQAIQEIVHHYVGIELAALTLNETAPGRYEGSGGTGLTLEFGGENAIRRLSLSLLGHRLEIDEKGRATLGEPMDANARADFLIQALRFVKHVPDLEPELEQTLEKKLRAALG